MNLKYVKIKDDHLAHHGVKGMKWGKYSKRSNDVLDSPGLYKMRTSDGSTNSKDYNTFLNQFNESYDAPRGTGNPLEINREKERRAYELALKKKFTANPFRTSMETIGQFAKGKIAKAKNWVINKMANWYSSSRASRR